MDCLIEDQPFYHRGDWREALLHAPELYIILVVSVDGSHLFKSTIIDGRPVMGESRTLLSACKADAWSQFVVCKILPQLVGELNRHRLQGKERRELY